ncbi:hypothetical protein TanjilG_17012 [Lupinus angustifolius]|nr:hypothetical protein TanjilG_17012 [Lupinus angustifolius]
MSAWVGGPGAVDLSLNGRVLKPSWFLMTCSPQFIGDIFTPTYNDYVLYNHGEGEEGTRKYRSRTFVPTEPEMDSVRRNKLMFGSKVDELQFSGLSNSCTPSVSNAKSSNEMKSTLLVDMSNSLSVP